MTKKSAWTVLAIAKGWIQHSIESQPESPGAYETPLSAFDLIQSIRITLVPEPGEIWVMDREGMVLYQLDSKMAGKIVFRDDDFSKFIGFHLVCKTIAATDSGEVTNTFHATGSSDPVDKTAFWQTVRHR